MATARRLAVAVQRRTVDRDRLRRCHPWSQRQYERGIPSTCWPTYASTRLLLIGATLYSRVSRNLRSTSNSIAKPYPPCVSRQALAASQAAWEASSLAMFASAPHF